MATMQYLHLKIETDDTTAPERHLLRDRITEGIPDFENPTWTLVYDLLSSLFTRFSADITRSELVIGAVANRGSIVTLMSDFQASSESLRVITGAIDQAVASPYFAPAKALNGFAVPPGLVLDQAEQAGLHLLRNLMPRDRGVLEFVPFPAPADGEPSTIESHGPDVADVLARWSQVCEEAEARAVLLHLVFLIRFSTNGMDRGLNILAGKVIESYLLSAKHRAAIGPSADLPGPSALYFLAPATDMLTSAMLVALISGHKRGGGGITEFVMALAPTYITDKYAEEIGFPLCMLDVLRIFPKIMPRNDVLVLLRKAERLCTGEISHQVAVEALISHPGLPEEDQLDAARRFVTSMIETATTAHPNDAMGIYLRLNKFCHEHGLARDPLVRTVTYAITTVAPKMELHYDRMEVPREVVDIVNYEIAAIIGRLEKATSLAEALAMVVDGPPPLPPPREGDEVDLDGLLLIELLKLGERNLPLRSVPIDHLGAEGIADARALAMVIGALVPAAALEFIGERFNPTEEATLATLPKFLVQPANRQRLARALMTFWSGDADRIDDTQARATLLIEGAAREVADHLELTDYQPPLVSGPEPHNAKHDGLEELLTSLAGRDELDQDWLDSIDFIARQPGVGLNLRNDTAHALNREGRRVFTGLALQAALYLVSVLGLQHTES
ncbi:hypothetical protein [Glycomyces sp. NPDC021274]|uniref:hypothetical protein n=1 Tax=Glycomyces sp. NPDC021274 TaxID=3155120 RepID=UPI0033D569B0